LLRQQGIFSGLNKNKGNGKYTEMGAGDWKIKNGDDMRRRDWIILFFSAIYCRTSCGTSIFVFVGNATFLANFSELPETILEFEGVC